MDSVLDVRSGVAEFGAEYPRCEESCEQHGYTNERRERWSPIQVTNSLLLCVCHVITEWSVGEGVSAASGGGVNRMSTHVSGVNGGFPM